MNPEWFAGRLRELRTAKGWTQGDLAERAGMAIGGITKLEQGLREPSWSTVLSLCKALGVECGEFQKSPGDADAPGRGRPKKEDEATVEKKPAKGF